MALSLLSAPVMAENVGVAQSTEASTEPQQFADSSVEDMVAVAKAGRNNEAINDAVLGNEAIRDNLPQLGEASDSAEANSNNNADATAIEPRQSTASEVENDKLILNSPVVDEANILTPQGKARLSQQLRSIYNQGLAQAAVVIVPTTGNLDIFDYGLKVAERWELGEADTDQGLLILVAVNDRKMHIFTGYGIEGVLPDAVASRIIREDITPRFKQGDYAGGLSQGINRIEERLTTDPDILAQADANAQAQQDRQSQATGEAPSTFGLFIIAFILGMFLTSVLGRFLGALVATGGFALISLSTGGSIIATAFLGFILWTFLSAKKSGGGRGGRGGGGFIVLPGGGGFGGGGFGGGGFGSGGFGGGGGGFGGGGAGGSW